MTPYIIFVPNTTEIGPTVSEIQHVSEGRTDGRKSATLRVPYGSKDPRGLIKMYVKSDQSAMG